MLGAQERVGYRGGESSVGDKKLVSIEHTSASGERT